MNASRFRGALLGLAAGDAVGTTNEFSHCPPPIEDMVGGGPFGLKPGEWTDDTSMALCLADSLLACRGFDPKDQMDRYLRWWRDGENSVNGRCFDIGATVAAALQRFAQTGDPFAGDPSPNAAGNGSLMRLAPVVLFYAASEPQAVHYAGESSRTTHAAPQAIDACRYYARLTGAALRGGEKQDILRIPCGDAHPAVLAVANGSYRRKSIRELKPTGYVVDSLEAALFCFAHAGSFRDGCLMAANLGGDADTIAAIYGQLAGAHYGEEGIPQSWRARLAWADRIAALADQLFAGGPGHES